MLFNRCNVVMNNYETVLILNPVLSEEQVKDSMDKFKSLLSSNGAECVFEDLCLFVSDLCIFM